ncbi:M23 family metallopeptidase [Jiangella mangrovi]|uniref:Murein DD-endopeptidase MepM/ murein hydrolase activator NlpD n=1 Tax=Jiangella mangrovi TaxID=1524084 RepID=A0A7W9LMF2_9ACTN|nr:M23 family metallopeptidase [Jiangella mangrovi]MBB5789223.1 murein DD-endopeptidase MepM/ murein hydrolase activator NlpD [Jiangella mangrovi]
MRCLRRRHLAAIAATAGLALAAGVPAGVPAGAEPATPPPATQPPVHPPTEGAPTGTPDVPPGTVPPPPVEAPPTTSDPDEAYNQGLEGAQTVAVAEAQRLLAQVMADLGAAQQVFAEASAAADDARANDVHARQQLEIATQAVARTQREIDDLDAQTEATRNTIGTIAREAYQGNNLAALGVVLGAETPDDLAARYMGMRTLLRTADGALGEMAATQAELSNAHARLEGQRLQREQLADQAGLSLAALETSEAAALAARQVVDNTQTLVDAALQSAADARLQDYQRYMELLQQSTEVDDLLATVNYGPGYGTGTFIRPGTGPTTSEYGPRLHPILGYVKIHTGLDFGRGDGRIYAADAGTVIEARWNNAYGNMVIVDHGVVGGQRLTTMYAHQADLMVVPGQRVEKGQYIGNIGSTGYSTGPHLHFEVRLDGQHTDPWPWVASAPLPGGAS